MTLKTISEKLAVKELSPVELVAEALDKAEKDGFGCYISTVDRDRALKSAVESEDRYISKKPLSPLDGIPFAVKDNILVSGMRMTCGSRMLEDFTAPYDASAVKRLTDAGCVVIGKTNLDEFGMGSSTENSAFFPTRNPRYPDRVPGGSSGGSAAAVSAGHVPFALGSDTGGSVRQPAAFCGICGLKPTYGSVSRYGLTGFASSLDVIGILADDPEGCSTVYDIISGKDEFDATSHDLNDAEAIPRTFAVCEELYSAADEDQRRAVDECSVILQELGFRRVSVSLSSIQYSIPAYYIISSAEASSNLARFDGIRYGKRHEEASDSTDDLVSKSRGEYLGIEVKRRTLLGCYALSAGQREDWYQKAMTARKMIAADFASAFKNCGIIIAPTAPSVPPVAGRTNIPPVEIYRSDIMTVPASLAGIPAVSIPFETQDHLPTGVQIMSSKDGDKELLSVSQKIYSMRKDS